MYASGAYKHQLRFENRPSGLNIPLSKTSVVYLRYTQYGNRDSFEVIKKGNMETVKIGSTQKIVDREIKVKCENVGRIGSENKRSQK
jgi:hypothetical protein